MNTCSDNVLIRSSSCCSSSNSVKDGEAMNDGTESISSGSVEVIAHVAGDGSIRTRSISVEETPRASLADDGCCEVSDSDKVDTDSNNSKNPIDLTHMEADDVRPELIPIGSNSDSDDSFLSEDGLETGIGEASNDSKALIIQSSAEASVVDCETTRSSSTEMAPLEDAVGMYDCLSDQFTSFFCPAGTNLNACLKKDGKGASSTLTNISCDVGCTEYVPFQDLFFSSSREASETLTSLQFWLSPIQQEELKQTKLQKPHNRSSYARKRRSKHVQTMWDTWHAEAIIPLERSKSLPRKLRLGSSHEETVCDVCYDSDPEQEHSNRKERCKQLERPAPVATPPPPSTGASLPRRRSYKDFRPSPLTGVPTIWEEEPCTFDSADNAASRGVPPTPRNSMTLAHNFSFQPIAPAQEEENFMDGSLPPRTPTHESTLESQRFFESPTGPTDYDMMDADADATLRQFIQEATNTKIPLTWHCRTKAGDSQTKLKAPVAVMGAFEVGAHLDNLVVQPKFTWSPVYEPHLNQRRIRLSGTEPDSIELLSIIRVVKPTQLNRNLYPFARLERTCCITTNDEAFPYLVLEAPSTRERDWLVNALKMIVARLASIIIVRDEAMLLEFFTPYAALMNMDADQHEEAMTGINVYGGPTLPPGLEGPAQPNCNSGDYGDFEQREDGPTLDPNGELQLLSLGHP